MQVGGCGSMSETGAGRPVSPGDSGPGDRTGDVAREAVLARAFVRLADTLASDFDIVDFLHGLAEDSVEILRAGQRGDAGRRARWAAADRLFGRADAPARALRDPGRAGPVPGRVLSGRAVQANAADSRVRWPVFAPQASSTGFQVMCAVPLRVRTDVIGALNLFRGSDEPFTGTEMEIAQAMAEMAAIGLIQERALRERNLLAAQLQAALNSRVIIEQAKGMTAEHLTVTMDDAFKLLRNYAHYHNRKLSEVASAWLTGESRAPLWADTASSPTSASQRVGHPEGGWQCKHERSSRWAV